MTIIDELNDALRLAVANADGNPEMFVFLLTAPLASWMLQGRLDQDTATEAIRLLHELHPSVTV